MLLTLGQLHNIDVDLHQPWPPDRVVDVGSRPRGSRHRRGTLTHDDYVAFMPQLDAAFAEQTGERLRLLFDARELQGWELRAALDDLKVVMTHGRQVERMALVTEARWMELLSNIGKLLLAGEMRHFHNRDEAEAWISA